MKTIVLLALLFVSNAFAASVHHTIHVGFYDPTIRFNSDSGETLSKKDILKRALTRGRQLNHVTHIEFSETIENTVVIRVEHTVFDGYDGHASTLPKSYAIQFENAYLAQAFFKMVMKGEVKSLAIATNFSTDHGHDDDYYTDAKMFIVGYAVK